MSGDPVVVIRAGEPTGEKDRYGHPVLGPDVEVDESAGALFAPASSSEPLLVGRSEVITHDTVYWRRSVDVRAGDRVRARGLVREVDGTPAVWKRGDRVVGVVVRLKSTEG